MGFFSSQFRQVPPALLIKVLINALSTSAQGSQAQLCQQSQGTAPPGQGTAPAARFLMPSQPGPSLSLSKCSPRTELCSHSLSSLPRAQSPLSSDQDVSGLGCERDLSLLSTSRAFFPAQGTQSSLSQLQNSCIFRALAQRAGLSPRAQNSQGLLQSTHTVSARPTELVSEENKPSGSKCCSGNLGSTARIHQNIQEDNPGNLGLHHLPLA